MGTAIEDIVGGYVRLKDRVSLERMREHRSRLLQESRFCAAQGFRVETLENALRDDLNALNEGLSRLSASGE